jgi:membrane protease YdiL (CAAX protease family)
MSTAPPPESKLGQLAGQYWLESRRPLASLVFVAPLLAAYEAGVLTLGVQNGADAWMRALLNCLGFGQHFLLPVLTVCILLSWHHLTRHSWRLSGGILSTMAVESIFLAVCLRLLLQLQGSLLQAVAGPMPLDLGAKFRDGIGFLGAGIYEELLFRLILLSLAIWAFRRTEAAAWVQTSAAIVVSSLIFAAAHYVGPYGDLFGWFGFLFRFLAGIFFSILFVYRGFGIAAGTHAAYDILVGLF